MRFLEFLFVCSVSTLTWNGLSDSFTNITYLLIVLFALMIRLRLGDLYSLKYINPLLVSITVSTIIAMLIGQSKLSELNLLANQIFSSSRFLDEQTLLYSPLIDLIPSLKWCLALVSLPYLVQVLNQINPKLLDRATTAWIVGLMFNIFSQMLQRFGVPNIGFLANDQFNLSDSRFPGLASHPNALAISVCLTIPLLFFPSISISKFVKYPAVLIMIYSVYVTGSRAGLIVLTLILMSILLIEGKTGKVRLNRLILISSIVCASVLLGFFVRLVASTRLSGQDISAKASNIERLQLLRYGWEAFLQYPITGAGTSLLKLSHNIFLQVLSSIGIFGFFCFLVFIFFLVYPNQNHTFYEKLPAIIFTVFGFFNNSLSDFYLYFPIGFAYTLQKSKNFILGRPRD
jgi:O-antigen ligase